MATADKEGAPGSTLEKLLAAGLGFIFLAVLAYAGLRERPITDPGQILFLRVVAAITAAACAAIIPGFIEIRFRNAIRAGGAIAVFAIVWFTNPPALVSQKPSALNADSFTIIVPNANALQEIDSGSAFNVEIRGKPHPLSRRGLLLGRRSLTTDIDESTRKRATINGEPQGIDEPFNENVAQSIQITLGTKHCQKPTFEELNGRIWEVDSNTCQQ